MLQNLRLWLLRRALLSASASHHQRAAEIGRKHCCENPAAGARNGENNLPPLHWREQPAGGGWEQRWVRVPRVLASRQVPRARPCTAAALEECSVLSFWPLRCTRTSLLAAAWQKENVADKYLQGRRKAAQIDVCVPSPALGWEENRACKMLGPSCSAKAKALWRDLSPDSDFYSWHVGKPPLSPPCRCHHRAPSPQAQTSNAGDFLTKSFSFMDGGATCCSSLPKTGLLGTKLFALYCNY